MAKSFKPSKFQEKIFDFVKNGKGNAVIDAVAGSGKSTTIVRALSLISSTLQILFLAFNKAIVEELKIKVGNKPNVMISTLHSLGFKSLRNTFRRIQVDSKKYYTYLNNAIKYGGIKPEKRLEWEEQGEYRSNLLKLTDLARVNLCETVADLFEVATKHRIFLYDNELEVVMNIVLPWGKDNISVIDYTDMIWLPNVLNVRVEQYDFVFIDECQDLNAAQRELFLKAVKDNGRFVAVGDPRQAIYGFAGADVDSFELLKAIPNTKLLPLSVCYRCDSKIINLAKDIVPQIEVKPLANEGTVNREAKVEDIKDGDMVVSRVTAPLVALCMNFIARGVKAYVKGRDIGQNLANMLKNTKRQYFEDTVKIFNERLAKVESKIMSKTGCSQEEAREDNIYRSMEDKITAIITIAGDLKTTDAVINRINTIFSNEGQGIVFSTVHKAKGLEAERVFILREDKFYLKHAMRTAWGREQERNLVYVAYTRAKNYLGFITNECDYIGC